MIALPTVIVGLAPVSRGMGVVAMEVGGRLLDWRVVETPNASDKNAWCLARAIDLFAEYGAAHLVLEDPDSYGHPKRSRIRSLLEQLTEAALARDISVSFLSHKEVRAALGLPAKANKDVVAKEIARRLPPLASRLPRRRRSWDAERYNMAIFTAAGLALGHVRRAQPEDRTE